MNKEIYPAYFKLNDGKLISVHGPKDCYVIMPRGANPGNEGVSINHYISRKKVLSYYSPGFEITKQRFCMLYDSLFSSYRTLIA